VFIACRAFLVLGILGTGALITVQTSENPSELRQAEDLYRHAEYEKSLALLDKNSPDPATEFLLGRDYLMLGEFKKSTDHLERAVHAAPNNAEYQDWLGRAWGKRAETSNILAAAGYAGKAREAFETSVRLDPSNSDALSDLFDYYLDAPGFMGGGYEKAMKVADQISIVDPSEGYFEKAKLAQKRQQYEDAEKNLRRAVAVAPHSVGHMIALARLLAKQGRTRDADSVLAQARAAAPESPTVWYATADIYIAQKRNLDEAKDLLQRYISAPLTPDDPPKQDALRLLKQVGGA
jgi:Flp pilus assembly protein TadD